MDEALSFVRSLPLKVQKNNLQLQENRTGCHGQGTL